MKECNKRVGKTSSIPHQMKWNWIALLLAFILCNCNSGIYEIDESLEKVKSQSVNVDSNRQAIINYISQSKSKTTRGLGYSLIPYVVDGDTVMYIANYKEGWEVFSNNTSLPMVLIRSKKGSFNSNSLDRRVPFNSFLMETAAKLRKLNLVKSDSVELTGMWKAFYSAPTEAASTQANEWHYIGKGKKTTLVNTYSPKGGRLSTKWGQVQYYNQCTPFGGTNMDKHTMVGCGAVAVGQYLFHHHKYFDSNIIAPSIATYNSSNNTYDFSGFNSEIWSKFDDGSVLNLYQDATAIYPTSVYLGYVANQIYSRFGIDGTDSDDYKILQFVNNITGLALVYCRYTPDRLLNCLKSGHPAIMFSSGPEGGHAYLIDNYYIEKEDYYDIYVNINLEGEGFCHEELPEDSDIIPPVEFYTDYYPSNEINLSYLSSELFYWVKANWGWCGEFDDIAINSYLGDLNIANFFYDGHCMGYPLDD